MYALQIENLHKIYANNVHALKGISLNIEEGDFLPFSAPMALANQPPSVFCAHSSIKPVAL